MAEFRWGDHVPHKYVDTTGPMRVECTCGWESKRDHGWAMDQYRAHVTSLMPKYDEIRTATKVSKLEHYGQTRGRRK